MDQWRKTRQANSHEHQCSEGAIFAALELGMQGHDDGHCSEHSNLSIEVKLMSDSSTTSEMMENMAGQLEMTYERPVDAPWHGFTPEHQMCTQDQVTQYEYHNTQHVQAQTNMFHVFGMIQQGVIRCRQPQAGEAGQHEDGDDNGIGGGEAGISAGQVLLNINLAEQEDQGRDEVRPNVDGLVVNVRPAANGGAHGA